MTNDEIDAAIGSIVPHEQEMHRLIRERAIFRAGMEAAAKICDKEYAANWHADAMVAAKQAKRCASDIRAAANAP